MRVEAMTIGTKQQALTTKRYSFLVALLYPYSHDNNSLVLIILFQLRSTLRNIAAGHRTPRLTYGQVEPGLDIYKHTSHS